MPLTVKNIKQKAKDLGFNLCGITPAQPSPTLSAYMQWIKKGMHGAMGYLSRSDRVIRRQDLQQIMPTAKSLIIIGLDYRSTYENAEVLTDPSRGRIASYAWGLDYHNVIEVRLQMFTEWLLEETTDTIDNKIYVDTGAILERSHAQQAGMGFIGKNNDADPPTPWELLFSG